MSTPTFIDSKEVSYSGETSPKTTPTLTCQAGDRLIAYAVASSNNLALSISDSTGLTWNLIESESFSTYTRIYLWETIATGSLTVTFTKDSGSGDYYGGTVQAWRNSDGIGASISTHVASGAPTVNLTTTQANSAIVLINGDYTSQSGTYTARTNAGAYTPITSFYDVDFYAVTGGYHADAGAIGTYAVGFTAPTAQKYSIAAIEIKGSAGGAVNLTVANLNNSNSLGIPSLTQQNTVAINNLSEAQSLANITLDFNVNLTAANLSTAQSFENLSLVQQNLLTIASLLVTQTLENLNLTQQGQLSINNLSLAVNLANISLAQQNQITLANLNQTQTLTSPTLTQQNTLTANNLSLNQKLLGNGSTSSVIVSWTISPDTSVTGYYLYFDTTSHSGGVYTDYANSIDVLGRTTASYTLPSLTIGQTYYINLSSHGAGGHDEFESELLGETSIVGYASIDLSTAITLDMNALANAVSLGSSDLVQQNTLAIGSLNNAQILENLNLIQQNILNLANLANVNTLDTLALIQQNTLTINQLNQENLLNNLTLIQNNVLSINNLAEIQTLTNLNLLSGLILVVQELQQIEQLANLTLTQQNLLVVQAVTQINSLTNIDLNAGNILVVNNLNLTETLANLNLTQASQLVVSSIVNQTSLTSINLILQLEELSGTIIYVLANSTGIYMLK